MSNSEGQKNEVVEVLKHWVYFDSLAYGLVLPLSLPKTIKDLFREFYNQLGLYYDDLHEKDNLIIVIDKLINHLDGTSVEIIELSSSLSKIKEYMKSWHQS